MEIDGQAALISGGGSGLGRATAQALAQAGVRVAILDVNEAAAVATAKEIGGLALACDVANAEETEQAVAAARERHGPARIAVACAGIGTAGRIVGRDGPLPLADFRLTINSMRQCSRLDLARPGTQPHRSTQFLNTTQLAQFVDDAVGSCGIEFAGVRLRQPTDVTRKFNARCLHPQTYAEIGHFVFARVADCLQHAFDAALAKSARHQNAVVIPKLLFACLLTGFQSFGTS